MEYEDIPDYLRNRPETNQRLLKKLIQDPKATKLNIVPMYSEANNKIQKTKRIHDEKEHEKVRQFMNGVNHIWIMGKKPTPEEEPLLKPIEESLSDTEVEKELLDTVCDLTDVCPIRKPILEKIKQTDSWKKAKKMIRTHIAMDKTGKK